jgi:hypothetical protein
MLGAFVLLAGGALLFVLQSDPSTAQLDKDIAQVRQEIEATHTQSAAYTGGAIKALIDLRGRMLAVTESMLEAKRLSWLRRVDLVFTTEGRPISVRPSVELKKMAEDIKAADTRIAEAEAKAAQFTGGLVRGLALMTAETERMTKAQLLLSYYSAKYGLAPPIGLASQKKSADPPAKDPIGKIVPDKDAL